MTFSIIDGNSLGYAAQSTRVLEADGIETQAVFHSLKTLKALKREFKEYPNALWLWDGRADFRFDLYPDYKGKRSDTAEKREVKEKYHAAQPYLKRALTSLGVTQVIAPRFEADDLAGYFVRQAERKDRKTQLITGDEDWLQLVSPLTCWHDPRKSPGKFCDSLTFEHKTGVSNAGHFLQVKALQGDTSDNISPVGGIGPKAAVAVMEHYNGVKGLIAAYKEHGEFTKDNLPEDLARFKKKLNDFCTTNMPNFTRNYRLMNLMTPERDEEMKADMQITRGKLDMDDFMALCEELRFMSILRNIESWEKSFGANPHV